ncbi:MAG: hypothetical protein AAFQ91_17560 [Cyanobacteria bacterium J06621_15]
MNTKFSLHIPPKMWSDFQKSMLESRMFNEEVIGFIFCQRHQVSKRNVRYIPKTWVVPTSECYEHQSTDGLVLTQRFHSYLLENHLFPGLDIVHIHTHAGVGIPEFSYIDNRYESEYAKFIASHFPEKPRLISGVFDEGLDNCKFRIWDRKGREFQQIDAPRQIAEMPILSLRCVDCLQGKGLRLVFCSVLHEIHTVFQRCVDLAPETLTG